MADSQQETQTELDYEIRTLGLTNCSSKMKDNKGLISPWIPV